MSMNVVISRIYHPGLKSVSRFFVPNNDLLARKRAIRGHGYHQQARIFMSEALAVTTGIHSRKAVKNSLLGVRRLSLAGGVFPNLSLLGPATVAGVAAAAAVGALLVMTMANQSDPQRAMLATREGMHLFVDGDIAGSIKKFDEALEMDSRQLPHLWQRGLSFYYVDRFEDGAKQFREDVAANPNDTEESIWCFLCEAQLHGVDEARRRFLEVGPDSRPIMSKVYNIFKYGGSVDTLVQSVENKDGADYFYATLYAGLYHEAHKQSDAAREAILASIRSKYGSSSNDYMAALARVHAECRGWI